MTESLLFIVLCCIVAGIIFALLLYTYSGRIKNYWSTRSQEDWRRNWRLTHSNSMRGNLVKTINGDINVSYYMDAEKQLGKGGCGIVVTGYERETGQEFAIKIVTKQSSERGRLDREIKLLKDVDHANIVRLFEVYDTPTHVYFVMELCSGGHLGELLAKQSGKCLPEDWAKQIIRQLVSAVAHLHGRGICHRDIKLQNILMEHSMNKSAQIKLIDFGYGSRFIGALPMRTKCGTPYTTAPEVLRESYDERCDVWSVGVVSFIVLSGKRPFEILDVPGQLAEAGKAAMMTNILMGRFSYNPTYWSRVSAQGVEFVDMLLHHDYKTRVYAQEALEHPWLQEAMVKTKSVKNLSNDNQAIKVIDTMRRNVNASALKKTGLVALVFGLTPDRSINIRSLFQSIDVDNSGALDFAEFKQAINVLAPELSDADITTLFDAIDIDGNKLISFTEFLAATIDPREIDLEDLNKAFKLLDADGNGYIEVNELETVLRTRIKPEAVAAPVPGNSAILSFLNTGSSSRRLKVESNDDVEAKIQDILQKCDLNGDGMISYDEFLAAMIDNVNMNKISPSHSKSRDHHAYEEEQDPEPSASLSEGPRGGGSSAGASSVGRHDDTTTPALNLRRMSGHSVINHSTIDNSNYSVVGRQSSFDRPTIIQRQKSREGSRPNILGGGRSSVYIDEMGSENDADYPGGGAAAIYSNTKQRGDSFDAGISMKPNSSNMMTMGIAAEGTHSGPRDPGAMIRKKSSVRDMSIEDEQFGQFGKQQLSQVQLSKQNLENITKKAGKNRFVSPRESRDRNDSHSSVASSASGVSARATMAGTVRTTSPEDSGVVSFHHSVSSMQSQKYLLPFGLPIHILVFVCDRSIGIPAVPAQ
jgi:calcium-dependent protein kinase